MYIVHIMIIWTYSFQRKGRVVHPGTVQATPRSAASGAFARSRATARAEAPAEAAAEADAAAEAGTEQAEVEDLAIG